MVSKVVTHTKLLIKIKMGYKHILKGITGSTRPGEILALMDPSGGGKTTLLKIKGGRLTDDVKRKTYNGIPYSPSNWIRDTRRCSVATTYCGRDLGICCVVDMIIVYYMAGFTRTVPCFLFILLTVLLLIAITSQVQPITWMDYSLY
ncbi:hypothetical protein F2Q69_00031752 [Brassica cretica]|uniref:ABC transporter domain-containing protein n=1 Tax=Brassica cretica TaxID=69181 RepID=A0A8S9S556_BRACR|nr:hypothetical protein F2Q69_00031752 [Brassica cretica]